MPNKIKNVFICSKCDAQSLKWSGRCLECGGWGTLQPKTIDDSGEEKNIPSAAPAEAVDLKTVAGLSQARIKTDIGELDRVLGGGLVAGSIILLGGEPGIGKSTIVAQIADKLSLAGKKVVYGSGEESAGQIKSRLERIKCSLDNITFLSETNVEKIIERLRLDKPALAIIDSIQTVFSSDSLGEAGSVSQIRAAALKFLEIAKKEGIIILLIGHITKDGQLAGPKSLEHIVDTVIYLETETAHDYRILRAAKNRFGSVNELGIFEMTGEGFKEILNPSAIFMDGAENYSGSIASAVMEGTRPFLVNIQALVSKTVFGYPQRRASGFDLNRLQVLCAVISKKTKINLANQDVILNIAGGFKIDDPGLDLPACLAISSSLLNQTIDKKTIVLGEVGLGGEVRNVAKLETRLAEAAKLGFSSAIIPDVNIKAGKMKLVKIKNISEILNLYK